ncbi:MAG: hypothetical protein FWB93_01395 [Oscillospiraceae bacterium]|nr:hypothetical protein [Oscillospiraceae bacterium]
MISRGMQPYILIHTRLVQSAPFGRKCISRLARGLLPEFQRDFESEQGKREFEEWRKGQAGKAKRACTKQTLIIVYGDSPFIRQQYRSFNRTQVFGAVIFAYGEMNSPSCENNYPSALILVIESKKGSHKANPDLFASRCDWWSIPDSNW